MTTKATIPGGRDADSVTLVGEPTTDAALLAAAAGLGFRATAHDRSGSTLGVLVDAAGAAQHLAVSQDGAWTLSRALPAGKRSFLLYESAANVLRGGQLDGDGSISYAGSSYVLEACSDGDTRTAKLRGGA
jgi:hypothetical protein